MRHIIIDGYNLLYSRNVDFHPHLDMEGKRNHLIHQIQEFARRQNSEIIIVFDSSEKILASPPATKFVKVRFTPPNVEADDVIKKMIRQAKNPQDLTIVSSDNAIQFTARSHGCRCLSAREFARMLIPPLPDPDTETHFPTADKHDPNLSDSEIEMWKRLFEQDSGNEKK